MKTNVMKALDQKFNRFILKNSIPMDRMDQLIANVRIGVLTERDIKLSTACTFPDSKFYKLHDLLKTKISHICTQYGLLQVILDESVDDFYMEIESLEKHDSKRLHDPEDIVNHENTLENFEGYKSERFCGNTTRLIDHAVQIIMSGKICHVLDHYMMGEFGQVNSLLASKIMRRLNNEFPHLQFKYDPFKNTISFKDIIDY